MAIEGQEDGDDAWSLSGQTYRLIVIREKKTFRYSLRVLGPKIGVLGGETFPACQTEDPVVGIWEWVDIVIVDDQREMIEVIWVRQGGYIDVTSVS